MKKTETFKAVTGFIVFFLLVFQTANPVALYASEEEENLHMLALPGDQSASISSEDALLKHEHDHDDYEFLKDGTAKFYDDDPLSPVDDNETEAASDEEDLAFAKPSSGGNGQTLSISKNSVKAGAITASSATISWSTTVPSDSAVEYGTLSSALTSRVANSTFVKSHTMSLTNLNEVTKYYYQVVSKDSSGKEVRSAIYNFTTTSLDVTAPVISGVASSGVTSSDATIKWTTNEPSTTQIEYGTTTAYSKLSGLNTSLVTAHSQTLSGLSSNTDYHYRVISIDASGNKSVSGDFTFKTGSFAYQAATIFLNFMGAFVPQWGSYSNLNMAAYAGPVGVFEPVLAAIREAYSIYNINVTMTDPFTRTQVYSTATEEANAKYSYYESNRVQELVVTNTSCSTYFGSACGGIAYVNSFSSAYVNTVFAFAPDLSNTAKYIWVAGNHELGHSFGLQHQSHYDASGNLINAYHYGDSNWAPIMGVGYSAARSTWWNGTTSSFTTYQDDIAVVSRTANGFGLRPDEAGGTPDSAQAFQVTGTAFISNGVITSSVDTDYYQFSIAQDGIVSFTAGVAATGAMLDLALEIRDAENNIVVSSDTVSWGENILNFSLTAGDYYLVVRSHGGYGDVGQYSVSGTLPEGSTSTAGVNAPTGASAITGSGSSSGGGLSPVLSFAHLALSTPQHPSDYFDVFYEVVTHEEENGNLNSIGRKSNTSAEKEVKSSANRKGLTVKAVGFFKGLAGFDISEAVKEKNVSEMNMTQDILDLVLGSSQPPSQISAQIQKLPAREALPEAAKRHNSINQPQQTNRSISISEIFKTIGVLGNLSLFMTRAFKQGLHTPIK